MSRCCKNFLDTITRRKPWDVRSLHQTEFSRNLNAVDLVGIGVGSTAGLGVFVIVSHVTKTEAGPAAVLSVLIASILALLSGLCHVELSTRLPRCGTGYTFCYITLGELLSFVIGWSTILENVLAGALATKAAWQYVAYMVNATNTSNVTENPDVTSEPVILMSEPDIFPCCLALAVVFLGFVTLKRLALINLTLTSVSGMVVFAFICVGFLHVQAGNWNSQPGFFAKGLSGIMTGASLVMIVFSGIDNLVSCVEETKTPSQTVSGAFSFTLTILSTVAFLVTSALTLSTPWQHLSDQAALARAYEDRGIFAANYVIGIGAVLGLVPCIVGSFIHPVRVLYAMSEDGLMPEIFSKRAYNGIPIGPHFLTGSLITLSALLLDFTAALEMASIATVIQFLSSSIILLFIRYQPQPIGIFREYSDIDNASISYSENFDMSGGRVVEKRRPQLMIFANGDCKVHHEKESSFPAMKKSISSDSALAKQYSSLYSESPITNTSVVNHKPALTSSNSHLVPSLLPNPASSGPITFFNRFKSSTKDGDLFDEPNNRTQSNNNSRQKFKPISVKMEDYETMQLNTDFSRSFGSLKSLASSAGSSIVALSSCDGKQADEQTWKHTRFFLLTYVTSSTCMTAMLWVWPLEAEGAWWAATLLIISIILMVISSVCIARKPQNNAPLYFKTPYSPLVPLLAITGNMAMLAALPFLCWLRFAAWLIPGLIIYVFYSHRHSLHQARDDQEEVLFDISQLNADNSQAS